MSPDAPNPSATRKAWRFMSALGCILGGVALLATACARDDLLNEQERQREGRIVAIEILCGGIVGVEDAGRKVLLDELPGTEQFRRPRTEAERTIARVYARAYALVISQAIARESGIEEASSVLRPDGIIDCDKLLKAANSNHPNSSKED